MMKRAVAMAAVPTASGRIPWLAKVVWIVDDGDDCCRRRCEIIPEVQCKDLSSDFVGRKLLARQDC